MAEWTDDLEGLRGTPFEVLEQMADEIGLPPPEDWESLTVHMNTAEHEVSLDIIANGVEYDSTSIDVELRESDDWDWIWDIWEWVQDYYPDVDVDSEYDAA